MRGETSGAGWRTMAERSEKYPFKAGTKLKHSLHDASGNLCVRAGTVITVKWVRILESRGFRLGLEAGLKVLQGPLVGKEFEIRAEETLIGRGPNCQVQIANRAVSSKHCILYLWPDGLFVNDLKSTNGTFVNKMQLTKSDVTELWDADVLSVGDVSMHVMLRAVLEGGEEKWKPEVFGHLIADSGEETGAGRMSTLAADPIELDRLKAGLKEMPVGSADFHRFLKTERIAPVRDERFASKPLVLIGDARSAVRKAFVELLVSRGCRCFAFDSVNPLLNRAFDDELPKAIIASVEFLEDNQNMMVKTLRRRPQFKNVPIFGLADAISPLDVLRLGHQGVNEIFLSTSFTIDSFLKKVSELLPTGK